MSEPTRDEGKKLNGAEAVDTQAADWMLARQLSEAWSEQDQTALDAWLAESTAHLAAYWRLSEAWSRTQRLKALRSPVRTTDGPALVKTKPHIVGFAAVLVIGTVLAGALWLTQFRQDEVKTYATPVGGHLALTLADGSKVELNTDTTLSISGSPTHRFANLRKGEAFFEIRHDAAHPFVVSVGDHRITDLGTRFLVRSGPAQISVALIDGKARFESDEHSIPTQSTDLEPGDIVVATANSMSVSKHSEQELKSRLSWRHGLLIFDNTTLAEAANELNRYNSEKIVIPDSAVARMTIGGTFFENDVPALLNTAKQVFGLSVHQRGNEIVISR